MTARATLAPAAVKAADARDQNPGRDTNPGRDVPTVESSAGGVLDVLGDTILEAVTTAGLVILGAVLIIFGTVRLFGVSNIVGAAADAVIPG